MFTIEGNGFKKLYHSGMKLLYFYKSKVIQLYLDCCNQLSDYIINQHIQSPLVSKLFKIKAGADF